MTYFIRDGLSKSVDLYLLSGRFVYNFVRYEWYPYIRHISVLCPPSPPPNPSRFSDPTEARIFNVYKHYVVFRRIVYVTFTMILRMHNTLHNIIRESLYKITSVREIWLYNLTHRAELFFRHIISPKTLYNTCHLPPGFGDIWQNIGRTSTLIIRKPTRHDTSRRQLAPPPSPQVFTII